MRRHATTLVVLGLLVGTAVAFAETERLKVAPTPIEGAFVEPSFSPTCGCPQAKAAIRLRLHRADRVTVRILDGAHKTVHVLADKLKLPRGRSELAWDGRNDEGARVEDGEYWVEVELARADRTIRLPGRITLDTVVPKVRLLSYRPQVLHRTQRLRVTVSYRISEPAHAVLFVNGKQRVVTYGKSRAAKLQWFGRSDGRPLRPGAFRLELAARDLAGNLGPRTRPFVVRVR